MKNEDENKSLESSGGTSKERSENDPKTIQGAKKQSRRMILWVVCALYLLYLAVNLAKGLWSGEVDTTNGKVISIAGCAVFVIAAVGLLVVSIRTGLRSFRESVDAMVAAEEAEERAEAQRTLEAAEEEESGADRESPPAGEDESAPGN